LPVAFVGSNPVVGQVCRSKLAEGVANMEGCLDRSALVYDLLFDMPIEIHVQDLRYGQRGAGFVGLFEQPAGKEALRFL
jgi:hypothetical protein